MSGHKDHRESFPSIFETGNFYTENDIKEEEKLSTKKRMIE